MAGPAAVVVVVTSGRVEVGPIGALTVVVVVGAVGARPTWGTDPCDAEVGLWCVHAANPRALSETTTAVATLTPRRPTSSSWHVSSSWRCARLKAGAGAERGGASRERVRSAAMSEPVDPKFPDGFTWGTATAAHQIEGGNTNNDWWAFEHTPGSGTRESSGDATDSYNRWPEDADVVKSIGFDNYRFSVEWSRIEPADGEFSTAQLDHYARVCTGLRERGIDPVVTFHHFTTPQWLADRGGWEEPDTADRFADFVARCAARLDGLMARACTINEPNIVSMMGYGMAMFPPGRRAGIPFVRAVNANLVDAHRKAVDAVRAAAPGTPVGLTLSMAEYVAVDGGEERMAKERHLMEDMFLDATGGDDFIGVQTYSRARIGPKGMVGGEPGVPVLEMGYEFWPQALEATLRRAWEYTGGQTPLLVTENGIGTTDDAQRIDYVHEALAGVLRALADGIDVRGYTYWSLLDNFEWAFGFVPRFGLVEVDRETFERTPKASAGWLADIIRTRELGPIPTA